MVKTYDLGNGGMCLIFSRGEWSNQDYGSSKRRRTQVKEVRFTYTCTSECVHRDHCSSILNAVARRDKEMGHEDIKYNFMVASNGTIFEGRGWDYSPESSPVGREVLDIAYIGNNNADEPLHYFQLASGLNIVKAGLKSEIISPLFNISYVRPISTEPLAFRRVFNSKAKYIASNNAQPRGLDGIRKTMEGTSSLDKMSREVGGKRNIDAQPKFVEAIEDIGFNI